MRLKKDVSIDFIENHIRGFGWRRKHLAPTSNGIHSLVMEKRSNQMDAGFLFPELQTITRISVYYIATPCGNMIVDIKYGSSGRRFLDGGAMLMGLLAGWNNSFWCRMTPVNVY